MDAIDRAYETERMEKEALVLMITRRKRGEGPVWISGLPLCRECGDVIPTERIRAIPDCSLCVGCQESSEQLAGSMHRS